MKLKLPNFDWNTCGPPPPISYNAKRNYQEDAYGKVRFFEGRYKYPTRIEGQQHSGCLRSSVLDGNSIGPSQVCYSPPQDYQWPGLIHRNPKVKDTKKPGDRRSPASV